MKSKHTLGPWTIYYDPINMREDQRFICGQTTGWGNDIIAEVETGGMPEREANARLISLAPEMLAAIETVLFAVTDDAETNGKVDQCALYLMCKNLIAKAKGEMK
jgi:hypothetical protein